MTTLFFLSVASRAVCSSVSLQKSGQLSISVRQFFQWFYFKSCSFSDCTGPYHTSGKGSGCLLVHCFHSHQCESECEYSAQLPRCGCPVTSKQTVFPLWEVKGKYQHFRLLCELIVHLMKYTFENELYFINIKKMVFC